MLIFIDTEFSDFVDTELLSIGLVSECGRYELYLENADYQLSRCSEFVRATVLPQLGKDADVICDRTQLKERLLRWLERFHDSGGVLIGYDYEGDWQLFCDALGNEVPGWIHPANIADKINDLLVEMYFTQNEVLNHHALHDARANRFAYCLSNRAIPIRW